MTKVNLEYSMHAIRETLHTRLLRSGSAPRLVEVTLDLRKLDTKGLLCIVTPGSVSSRTDNVIPLKGNVYDEELAHANPTVIGILLAKSA